MVSVVVDADGACSSMSVAFNYPCGHGEGDGQERQYVYRRAVYTAGKYGRGETFLKGQWGPEGGRGCSLAFP